MTLFNRVFIFALLLCSLSLSADAAQIFRVIDRAGAYEGTEILIKGKGFKNVTSVQIANTDNVVFDELDIKKKSGRKIVGTLPNVSGDRAVILIAGDASVPYEIKNKPAVLDTATTDGDASQQGSENPTNLTGSQGPAGPTGPAGPAGPAGPTGPAGDVSTTLPNIFTASQTFNANVIVNSGQVGTVDLVARGDTDPALFAVDSSADKVGVGTVTPTAKLEVNGGIKPLAAGINQCGTANFPTGTMFYNSVNNYFCYCDNTAVAKQMQNPAANCF
jgi:hypothetical protein